MISIRRETHKPPNGARRGDRPLYAIGDVHGCYDLLHILLGAIGRDASERHPGVTPVLVLCGDYIDRGPRSAEVLSALCWLSRSSAVDVELLEGNHEAMLRGFLEHPAEYGAWLSFGGSQTLQSYGIEAPEEFESAIALTELRDRLLDVMPAAHHIFLQKLKPTFEEGDYVFVHAGVKPRVPLRDQTRDDLLWIREEFLNHPDPAKSVIVHGHTFSSDRPMLLSHRLGIDTGAFQTGVLTGLRIDDHEVEVLQAVDEASTTPAI